MSPKHPKELLEDYEKKSRQLAKLNKKCDDVWYELNKLQSARSELRHELTLIEIKCGYIVSPTGH